MMEQNYVRLIQFEFNLTHLIKCNFLNHDKRTGMEKGGGELKEFWCTGGSVEGK